MAGQPKRMARRLTELEERVYQLSVDVGKLCPHQYRKWQEQWDEDDYAAVWCKAVAATKFAANAVNYALGLAEERALGEDAAEELDMERDKRRGTWPLDEAGNVKVAGSTESAAP